MIREWLLPGWLMAVQAFVTLALMLSLTAQVLLACVIVRWPLRTVLRYEWIFVSVAFVLVALSSKYFYSLICFIICFGKSGLLSICKINHKYILLMYIEHWPL